MANCTAVSRDKVSAMPASSIITKLDGATAAAQFGRVAMVQRPGELGEGVGADAGLLGEDGGRGGRGGKAEHLAAVLGPGQDEGAHSGRFSRPRRGGPQARKVPPGCAL